MLPEHGRAPRRVCGPRGCTRGRRLIHSAQCNVPSSPSVRPRPPLPSLPRAARRLLLPKEDSRMKPCRHSSASKLAQDDRLRTGPHVGNPRHAQVPCLWDCTKLRRCSDFAARGFEWQAVEVVAVALWEACCRSRALERPPQPGQNGSETSAWASLRRGHWSRFCNLPLLI